tara:strand:- start:18170 stop:18373 length:204 start_codon:yes stop_codon:yes gene_type:complete
MLALFPAPLRPVMMLACSQPLALKTTMMCTCPAVEATTASQIQVMADNGIPVFVAIWALMTYAIFKN